MQRHEKESSDDGTDVLGGFGRKCLVFLLVLYVLHLCLKCVAKIQPFFDCYKEITIANGSVLRGTFFHEHSVLERLVMKKRTACSNGESS